MRIVVQRVNWAKVTVEQSTVASIGRGFAILLGIGHADTEQDADYLARKVVGLRLFEDDAGKMNLDLGQVKGELLVVSQFTLYGNCQRGRRPYFGAAMEPKGAERLCTIFAERCRSLGAPTQTGQFRASMEVELCNNGPVTLILDSADPPKANRPNVD